HQPSVSGLRHCVWRDLHRPDLSHRVPDQPRADHLPSADRAVGDACRSAPAGAGAGHVLVRLAAHLGARRERGRGAVARPAGAAVRPDLVGPSVAGAARLDRVYHVYSAGLFPAVNARVRTMRGNFWLGLAAGVALALTLAGNAWAGGSGLDEQDDA